MSNWDKNPVLEQSVDSSNELKSFLVNYVGNKINPENNDVTVENIVEVMSKDFPEFLLAVAEENFIRGYHQALHDAEIGEKLYNEQLEKNKK
jgi:deoxyhypusine synthase